MSAQEVTSRTSSLLLVLVGLRLKVSSANYDDIARESAYIRLQASLQEQTASDKSKPISVVLGGITELHSFSMALTWASRPNPEIFVQYLPNIDEDVNESEHLLGRLIAYFCSLLDLYYVAEKLVMKNLQRQILELFNIDAPHTQRVMKAFPKRFLTASRAPTYGMLGMYLYEWLELVHRADLHELSLEEAEPLLDAMEFLRQDRRVDLARAKLRYKSDIRRMARSWRINPVDDVPHRFTVFPSQEPEPEGTVAEGQKDDAQDNEIVDF